MNELMNHPVEEGDNPFQGENSPSRTYARVRNFYAADFQQLLDTGYGALVDFHKIAAEDLDGFLAELADGYHMDQPISIGQLLRVVTEMRREMYGWARMQGVLAQQEGK